MDSKNVITSKTILGLVIAVAAPYLAKHGIVLDQAGFVDDIVTLLGAALAVYGRFKASKALSVLPK